MRPQNTHFRSLIQGTKCVHDTCDQWAYTHGFLDLKKHLNGSTDTHAELKPSWRKYYGGEARRAPLESRRELAPGISGLSNIFLGFSKRVPLGQIPAANVHPSTSPGPGWQPPLHQ